MVWKNKKLLTAVKLVVLLLTLWYLSNKIEVGKVFNSVKQANLWWFVLALIIFFLNLFLSSFKWKKILEIRGVNLPYFEAFSLYIKGYVFNYLLPTSVGGDLVKIQSLKNKHQSCTWSCLLTASFFDRLSGLVAVVIIIFFSSVFIQEKSVEMIRLISFGLVTLAVAVIFLRRNIFLLLKKNKLALPVLPLVSEIECYSELFLKKGWVIYAVIFSLAFHLLGIFAHYLLFIAVGSSISLLLVYLLIASSRLVDAIPISFGGVGVRESFLVLMGLRFGVSPEEIISYSLLAYTLPLILVAVCLFIKTIRVLIRLATAIIRV